MTAVSVNYCNFLWVLCGAWEYICKIIYHVVLVPSGTMNPSNQASQNSSQCIDYVYDQNIIPALTFLMFPLALLLNGVAAWVSLHLKSTSTFVVYLKNLVAADFILTLLIPLRSAADLPDPPKALFKLTCRFISTTFYSTLYTCITLLGFISLDRFFKIMAPQSKLVSQNLWFSKVTSGIVWLSLFGGAALPNIILTDKSAGNETQLSSCMALKGPAGLQLHSIVVIALNVLFWIVSVVVAVCYICIANKVLYTFRKSGSTNEQGKQKIKLRVFLVVIVFVVSFVPYHIIRIPYTFQQVTYSSTTSCFDLKAKFAKEFSLWLATTNTCMDPLLYVFLCREFKEKLVSIVSNVAASVQAAVAGSANAASSKTRL